MDDFTDTGVAADLEAGLASLDLPAEPTLDPADEAAGWKVKPKGEPEVEREATVAEDLADAMRDQAAGADDGSGWAREQRRLADEALRRAGLDPAERHTHGLSRREVWRRYDQAEQMLRADPRRALNQLARAYGVEGFDIENPAALAEQDLAELARYRQQQTQMQQALGQAEQRARSQLQSFVGKIGPEKFEASRRLMSALISSGSATSLEQAYEQAQRHQPGYVDPKAEQEASAKAEAERRRQEVAKAKAAGTPQTKSAPGRAVEPDRGDRSIKELLEETWNEMSVGA